VHKQQIEQRKTDHYGVVGDLTFESVVTIEKEGFAVINEGGDKITLDLSHVQVCSSAAVALLLSWLRYAKKRQTSLVFSGVPASLMAMIQSAELESIITVQH